jgi:phosphoglycerol transferase
MRLLMANRPAPFSWREPFLYLLAVFVPLVLLIWLMDLPRANLNIPFTYGVGDSPQVQMWVKGLLDNPWLLHNDYLGMPGGQDLHEFPMSDSLQFLLLKLFAVVLGNPFAAVNVYFLLGFPLTALTTLFVLRHLGISPGPALVSALLYAFLPYHFLRGVGHLFLASYWMVPLLVWLALKLSLDQGPFWKWDEVKKRPVGTWRSWGSVTALVLCLIVACTGVYYAFFGCFLLLIAGLSTAMSRKLWYPLISAGVLVAAITAGVAANIAPTILYQWQHGPNPKAVERVTLNAEFAGLKITYLLLPVEGHRLPPLAKIRERYDAQCRSLHLPTASGRAGLGVLAGIGFVFLIARMLLVRDRNGATVAGGLAMFNLSAVLLGTLGGFGVFIALVGIKWIRGYERISVLIGFFALSALALLLDSAAKRWAGTPRRYWLFHAGLAAMVLLGVLDQTKPGCWFEPHEVTQAAFENDARFVSQVESAVPADSMIFQLPFVAFPEVVAPHKMHTYDHARGYLHSRTLRWNYGVMKGRPASDWQERIAKLPAAEMVHELRAAGFHGLTLDRLGYADNGVSLEAELSQLLGRPRVVSDDRRLLFFDLTKSRRRPIG